MKPKSIIIRWLKLLPIVSLMAMPASAATTFYVSPSGKNTNAGRSESQPFQEVQHALDKMAAGDTLIVLDGNYTGTLQLKSDITIKAKNPRKVVFSGAETLKGTFRRHSGNVYKIEAPQDIKQLFYKGSPMTWATFPNIKWSENWMADKKWLASSKGSGPGILRSDAFSQIADLDLTGGYCFLRYSKGNSCYSRPVKSFNGRVLRWDDTDFYSVAFSGEDGRRGSPAAIEKGKSKSNVRAKFFLAGALDLLDTGGEWFAKDEVLYFYSPEGGQPDPADILIKTNDYAIHETEPVSNVSIQGIDFFATSVKLMNPDNENIRFQDSQFSYIGSELLFVDSPSGLRAAKPIHANGSGIEFDRCLFAGGQNTGLDLKGEDLTVKNCVFMENNRHANFESRALTVSQAGTVNITGNTFFNNCSDAVRITYRSEPEIEKKPQISYNNIFNAGIYNADVSGVYMPNLSQHWTEIHHNWVHNCKGNGVRLDQAGEKLTVHHNVFWASKRGLNIEGFGNFNIYNNTSVLNKEAGALTRNVVSKRKGTGTAFVSNDTTFPPITDWNVLNNLVQELGDRVGPSEKGPFDEAKKAGTLNPERAKQHTIPIRDRGAIKGNITGFEMDIFTVGKLDGLNLIPSDKTIENGVRQTPDLAAEGVTDLDSFRGAYGITDKGWHPGSDWMPYGLAVPKTMAESEAYAKKYHGNSVVPKVSLTGLPEGKLSPNNYVAADDDTVPGGKGKKKRKGKGKSK